MVLAACTATLMSPNAAIAAGSKCSTTRYNNFHAGYDTARTGNRWGSQAVIEYNNPDLCGSDTDGSFTFSVAWVMVSSTARHTLNQMWAQAGYGQFRNAGDIAFFSEFTRQCLDTSGGCDNDNNYVFQIRSDLPNPQGSQVYKVWYAGGPRGDQHLHMAAGGENLDETGYDPTDHWQSDWDNEFHGETKHEESDIPGTSLDKTSFSNLQNQNGLNPADWNDVVTDNMSVTGADVTARYHEQKAGAHSFWIWTDEQ